MIIYMATFQKIVRLYCYFYVFILMIVIAILMGQAKKNTKFPPQVGCLSGLLAKRCFYRKMFECSKFRN